MEKLKIMWPLRTNPAQYPDGHFQMSQAVGREQEFSAASQQPRAAWGLIDLERNRAFASWRAVGCPANSTHGSPTQSVKLSV